MPLEYALAAMFVPAQKEDGVLHLHGYLRVPLAALAIGMTEMVVDTDGQPVRITAPTAVASLATQLERLAKGARLSLHVAHD
jgi:hypothetical protein